MAKAKVKGAKEPEKQIKQTKKKKQTQQPKEVKQKKPKKPKKPHTDHNFTAWPADEILRLVQEACHPNKMPSFFRLVYSWTTSQYEQALCLAWDCLKQGLKDQKPRSWHPTARAEAEARLLSLDIDDSLFTRRPYEQTPQIWDAPEYHLPWQLARDRHGERAATLNQAFLTWTWYERGRDVRKESRLLGKLNELRQNLSQQADNDQQWWSAYHHRMGAVESAVDAPLEPNDHNMQVESPVQYLGEVVRTQSRQTAATSATSAYSQHDAQLVPGLQLQSSQPAGTWAATPGRHVFGQASFERSSRPVFDFTQLSSTAQHG